MNTKNEIKSDVEKINEVVQKISGLVHKIRTLTVYRADLEIVHDMEVSLSYYSKGVHDYNSTQVGLREYNEDFKNQTDKIIMIMEYILCKEEFAKDSDEVEHIIEGVYIGH